MAINFTTVLTTAMNKVVSLASSKVDKSVIKNVYTTKTLTTTVTNGSGWTNCAGGAILSGNTIRLNFSGTRSTATGDGNITNETMCTMKINTGGYIKDLYNASGISGTSGNVASFYTSAEMSGTTLTVTIHLGATLGAITSTNGYILCCATLDSSAYL